MSPTATASTTFNPFPYLKIKISKFWLVFGGLILFFLTINLCNYTFMEEKKKNKTDNRKWWFIRVIHCVVSDWKLLCVVSLCDGDQRRRDSWYRECNLNMSCRVYPSGVPALLLDPDFIPDVSSPPLKLTQEPHFATDERIGLALDKWNKAHGPLKETC